MPEFLVLSVCCIVAGLVLLWLGLKWAGGILGGLGLIFAIADTVITWRQGGRGL